MDKFSPTILIENGWNDYALIDSGHGRKLERFGAITVSRPEPQALWQPLLPEHEWNKADASFTNASEREDDDRGSWNLHKKIPETWETGVEGIKMNCQLMSYRHMGLFPEQRPHWQWIASQCKTSTKPLKILNLFAYTGAASLICAAAGAQVTHVDASKKAIQWAKDNQQSSGLPGDSIRWICDDAADFVAREVRRGNSYDGILLDPPRYGRGPKGEVWKFENDTAPLLKNCAALLSPDARFMILTAYALRLSALSLTHMMTDALGDKGGTIDYGELLLMDQSGTRPLPTSMFCRWTC